MKKNEKRLTDVEVMSEDDVSLLSRAQCKSNQVDAHDKQMSERLTLDAITNHMLPTSTRLLGPTFMRTI